MDAGSPRPALKPFAFCTFHPGDRLEAETRLMQVVEVALAYVSTGALSYRFDDEQAHCHPEKLKFFIPVAGIATLLVGCHPWDSGPQKLFLAPKNNSLYGFAFFVCGPR
jgi:hypothetical protein